MPRNNSEFRFKQFAIRQDKTAMKIGTDGVIFGSWCNFNDDNQILDIGTGTGILALMAAQKSDAKITAIEIDNDAYFQAMDNISNSKFSNQINVINADFLSYDFANSFDHIISNPPFFENSLKSTNQKRNLARHTDSLPFEKLIKKGNNILTYNGKLSLIIPSSITLNITKQCALCGLHLFRKCEIITRQNQEPTRTMLSFSKQILPLSKNTITITDFQNQYTAEYKELTKDFYVKL